MSKAEFPAFRPLPRPTKTNSGRALMALDRQENDTQ
ncbi:hypothetical protein Rleg4DRAFT_3618 [Rhizobium leguminosarum bv. trifolii WSM2297]|uniref:Uncharacterized protein n=1 Tax=Rhizobium leguminosarum bv. trifolii WSM2297 TaxID=754762 RepID=J0W9Q9_RHILT|nr:hypothetical protein Rleg4DRAFT_3618 [Rhizobium leguminosarum bv. trifolii WSM2297]